MADLHHLLDELNHPEREEEQELEEEQQPEEVTDEDNDHDTTTLGYNNENNDTTELVFVASTAQDDDNKKDSYVPHRLDLQDVIQDISGDYDNEDSLFQQQEAYRALKSWWKHELYAPEVLPWQGELMTAWIQRLNQEDDEEDDDNNKTINIGEHGVHVQALLQSIRRMDRQHVQFMVSNLLSTRLLKIQRYHSWLMLPEQQVQLDDCLGPAERDFLIEYHALWKNHMEEMVTNHFPQQVWKPLNEPEMVEAPDWDEFCWVRFLEETTLHLSQSQSIEDDEDLNQRYTKGTVLVIPYRQVRDLIQEGKAELFL